MELKLPIYNKNEIVKMYETDTYYLMLGTVEDVVKALNPNISQVENNIDLATIATDLLNNSMQFVKDLLKDIFEGITDDELRNTRAKDIVKILIYIIKYSIIEMNEDDSKNV